MVGNILERLITTLQLGTLAGQQLPAPDDCVAIKRIVFDEASAAPRLFSGK